MKEKEEELKQKERAHEAQQAQTQNLLSELQILKEENEKRTSEIEQLKR